MATVTKFVRRARSRGWSPRPRPRRRRRVDPRLGLTAVFLASLFGLAAFESGWMVPPHRAVRPAPALHTSRPSTGLSGHVVRVIDGDTFRLSCCRTSIRLWGIDAPERDAPGGTAATAALRTIIASRLLTCAQRDIDRYGRIVGQCTLEDGTDIGRRLLQTGTVREYCFFSGNHYRTC